MARDRLFRSFLALCAVTLLGVAWRGQQAFQYEVPRATGGWILLAAATAAAVLAMLALRRQPPFAPTVGSSIEWPAVLALCILGAGFRLVRFYVVPEGMNHDAGWYGQYANEILRGTPYTPYIAAAWGRETLFMYVVAPFIKIFGNTPEALQAASSLWGIAALVPFYLLTRAMFGSGIALAALGFLAVSGWHGVFSRAGWRVITVPPFEMIALLGAWQVGQRGARRDWIVLGFGAAASIYTYNAGRIIPIICAVYVLGLLVARRHEWLRIVRGALVALGTFLIVGAPMIWYAATHFEQFQSRASYLEQERAEHGFLWNAVAAGGLFNYRGNGNDFFISEPLLEPMAGAVFAIGAIIAVLHIRERAARFLLGGLVLALIPGVLAVPNANRCITALPFTYLLMAFGLRDWLAMTIGWIGQGKRAIVMAGVVAVLLGVAAVESYSEFIGPEHRLLYGFSPAATAAGLAMRQHIDRYQLFTVAGWPENTLTYLAYDGHGSPFEREYLWGQSYDDVAPAISPFGAKGLLFLIEPIDAGKDALRRLQERFPVHRLEPLLPPRLGDQVLGHLLFVDRRPANEPLPPNAFDGTNGHGPAQFVEPMGVTFDPDGNLYVSDRVGCRVQKFNAQGDFLRAWGHEGDALGEFREPRDLAADERYLYVSDTWNQRIQIFTHEGESVREIRPNPGFIGARGIAVRDGRIYVADTGRSIVRVFDTTGRALAIIGERDGDAPGHLIEPADVATDAAGQLYVINSGNNRIEVFDSAGRPVAAIPISGWQGRGAKEAYLAIDAAKVLYLSDPDSTDIRRFAADGQELAAITIPRLDFPSGVAVNNGAVVAATRRWDTVRGTMIP